MALYHKHRPQTFDTVIGQEHIVETLKNQIALGKVAHAYLFSGPRGVGKTTLARILAKGVNCTTRKAGDGEPCDTCTSCTEITTGRSIDVIEIDAASHTGVDNVRENIIENAQFRPTKSPFKVFIIDEVHMLSTSAFNALLKTLEEPPSHVLFILATTEKHKLPETIISRCQRFDFKHVPFDAMVAHLGAIATTEGVKVDREILERIANKSDGCVRDGVSLLDQLMATGEKKITAKTASIVLPTAGSEQLLNFVQGCMKKNAGAALVAIHAAADTGASAHQFATDILDLLRALLIMSTGSELPEYGFDITGENKKVLQTLAKDTTAHDLVRLTDLAILRRGQIKSAAIPILPLELLVIEWCAGVAPITPPPVTPTATATATTPIPRPVEPPQPAPSPKTAIIPPIIAQETKPTDSVHTDTILQTDAILSIEIVQKMWPQCLVALEKISPSLTFVIKSAELIEPIGNTVRLSVPFALHRDKIMDLASRKHIEDALGSVFGGKTHIDVLVTERPPEPDSSSDMQELAALMGGQVI